MECIDGCTPLLVEECFSSGAADTETERARAKAKMALWKVDFIFAACRKPRFES
jgi:hypothetical protein